MRVRLAIAMAASFSFWDLAAGQPLNLSPETPVEFSGPIKERNDLSAIGQIHSYLVIGSDEAIGKKDSKRNVVQLLRPDGKNRYAVHKTITLCDPVDSLGNCKNKLHRKEMDIEGIAVEDSTLYVIGSHSARRKKVRCEPVGVCNAACKKPRSYSDNRAILRGPLAASAARVKPGRDRLLRLRMDSGGTLSKMEEISLRQILDRLSVFQTFNRIPGKENGVDIEGIAVRDGLLHIGFRSPVLRGNYVPVLKLRFDAPEASDKDVVYVKLGGRGIRDLARVSDGFLILAGPSGEGSDSYQLYHWDGRDMVPGGGERPEPMGSIKLLGEIAHPECGKPEGLMVQHEDDASYDIIVVHDGKAKDIALRFHVIRMP